MLVFALALVLLHPSLAVERYYTRPAEVCMPFNLPGPEDPCRPGGFYDFFYKRCTGYRPGDLCFQCHKGVYCEERVPLEECYLDASLHHPFVYDEYWSLFGGAPCDRVPNPYRLSYMFGTAGTGYPVTSRGMLMKPLDELTRQLHAMVGNAETEGRIIVPSVGATQGIVAALYALSQTVIEEEGVEVADVYVQSPYYNHLPWLTENLLKTTKWNLDADPTKNTTIEIVTWANNPDGQLLPPKQPNKRRRFFDLSYYWPTFVKNITKVDDDIMVFSGSKNNGLAGSRSGWVIVKEGDLSEKVMDFVGNETLAVAIDTQIRQILHTEKIIESHQSESPYGGFYDYMSRLNYNRIRILTQLFETSENYTFMNAELGTIGAVAWVKCNMPDCNCFDLFNEIGLLGEEGELFGASKAYLRLSLGNPNIEFRTMLLKIYTRLHGELPSIEAENEVLEDLERS